MTLEQMTRFRDRLREGLESLKLDEHPSAEFLIKTTDARCAMAYVIGGLSSLIEEEEDNDA